MTETTKLQEAGGRKYIPGGPEIAEKASGLFGADTVGSSTLGLYRVSWKKSALVGCVIKDRLNGGTKQLPAYAAVNPSPPKFITGYDPEDATRSLGTIYTGGAPFPQYVDLERLGTVVDATGKPIVR